MEQVQEIIIEYISKGYTTVEILDHITKVSNEMLDNQVDLSSLKELAQPFIDMDKTYFPSNEQELDEGRKNLYKLYDIEFEDDEKILENSLCELSKYDKLIKIDQQPVPYLLNQIIITISGYRNLLETWAKQKNLDTLNRTIAHTSSTTREKMLSPLKPYTKENYFNNPTRAKTLKNICEEFIEDPYGMNFALTYARYLKPESFIKMDQDKVDSIFTASEFLNSTGAVIKRDIITSLKIQISMYYLNDQIYQKILKPEKHISKEKLATHIDVIINHLFECKSNTSSSKLGAPIQVRTFYEGIPILEYVRKGKEKINPALHDKDYLDELSEKIKGKVPPKSSC